ncbi:MAG: potassium transporter [Gammaproteobacteria bacterium]|nr:potassium transporter [Gammaproteobacteria bacterium]
MYYNVLAQILLLLGASVVAVALFRRLSLPPVLGYFVVGFALGPHLLGIVDDNQDARFLAEFGVVFLLFTLGLQFSFPRLVAMRRQVLGLGSAQVLLTTLLAAGVAVAAGLSPEVALLLGGAAAMSSTAVVIRELGAQGDINQPHGNNAIGVLLFQDLAVVPFLVLIPLMAGSAEIISTGRVLLAILQGFAAVAAVFLAGRYLMRPLFQEIARGGVGELFTMAALLIALAAAWLTHAVGLSYALGGFLAGMLLGETEYRHQVAGDIRPFRDLLLGLFFITVGMLIDWRVLADNFLIITLLVIGLVLAKAVIIALIARIGGSDSANALRTGLVLAQGGEFGIALVTLGLQREILPADIAQLVLASLVVSMALTPVLIKYNRVIAGLIPNIDAEPKVPGIEEPDVGTEQAASHEHVIICGYGRVGQNIARALEEEGIEFVALDLDPYRVRAAREAGDAVIYGSATRPDMLRAAGVYHATAAVITYREHKQVMRALRILREGRADLPILVRTRDDTHLNDYLNAGATEVVPESLEASLMVMSHLLLLLKVPVRRIQEKVQGIRQRRYGALRKLFRKEFARPIDFDHALREQLRTVVLPPGARAVNRTLGSLQLENSGVLVTALRRDGIVGHQPESGTTLHAGDVLILYGTPENLEHGEELLLQG